MLPEKIATSNTSTATSVEPKAPKSINATSTTTMREPTEAELEAADYSDDPIGALRMQRAASFDWEARQYTAKKAAKRDPKVVASPRAQPNFSQKRNSVRFSDVLNFINSGHNRSSGLILRLPSVTSTKNKITYHGVTVNDVDKFLNIPYGQDTAGARRFAPPVAWKPDVTDYDASAPGPVCPQPVKRGTLRSLSEVSEDCLRLKVVRPAGTEAEARLPVMVWIYDSAMYDEHINMPAFEPDALIAEAVANGMPVVVVAMNYRVNIFGFPISEALGNNSLNAGLRDQRLALEWVQDNIEYFGGDPDQVTLFGDEGPSVAYQILAYGGSRPAPFHAAIMMYTSIAPTSTSSVTLDTFNNIARGAGCAKSDDPQSAATLSCLRDLLLETLINATKDEHKATHDQIFFPAIDGDFVRGAPSELVRAGAFARAALLLGWDEDEGTLFALWANETADDPAAFLSTKFPGLSKGTIDTLTQTLYPRDDFAGAAAAARYKGSRHSDEFYRSARLYRDISFVCPSLLLGHAMAEKFYHRHPHHNGNRNPAYVTVDGRAATGVPVFYYDQNQTVLTPGLDRQADLGPGLGVVWSAEQGYVFANFTPYIGGWDGPTLADDELRHRQSRSWSTFASTWAPSADGKETLYGWEPAYERGDGMFDARVYVVGGATPGISALDEDVLASEKLKERCKFLNSEDVIKELQY